MSKLPWQLTALDLARRLRRGQLSAVEALESHLERIERVNPAINAVVSLDAEQARKTAEEADAAISRGEPLGHLHGIPMTLKDAHDIAGLRTTIGLPDFDRVADEDGTVAARLRAAGANIIGHTNVAAGLGDYLQSANQIFGRTANPWDPARNPGGSSGGAAAALAAGMTLLEVGSDMMGSTRLPAAFCGVYGLKTTEHRVPLTGFFRLPGGAPRTVRIISTLGPMARDLDDLELALRIISGPDGQDGDIPPVPLGSRRRRPLEDLRLAVVPTLPGITVGTSMRRKVEQVASQAAIGGAKVVERLPEVEWDALHELFGKLLATITNADPAGLPEDQRTAAWYLGALARRDGFIATWQGFFDDADVLILPAAMTGAFANGESASAVDHMENWRLHGFANLTGLPALVVPAGLDDDGMPLGIQLVGPLWSEMRLLAIARELERAGILPGFQPPPETGVG